MGQLEDWKQVRALAEANIKVLEPVLAPTPTPTPVPVPVPTPAQGKKLVFEDNFDGSALDPSKWASGYPWTNPDGNYNRSTGEQQVYLSRNIVVSGGTCKLVAKKETVNGRPYSSGMIASYPRDGKGFLFTYGYIEARMKMPKGKGFWPAFWTLPWPVAWPPEHDIVEVLGDRITTAEFHYHYNDASGVKRSYGKAHTGADLSADFHTYGLLWEPGYCVWYLDGIERARFASDRMSKQPMYLLLNLAVGGSWPGSPDSSTVFPAALEISQVRVYQ